MGIEAGNEVRATLPFTHEDGDAAGSSMRIDHPGITKNGTSPRARLP
jgi:hypothetical protein